MKTGNYRIQSYPHGPEKLYFSYVYGSYGVKEIKYNADKIQLLEGYTIDSLEVVDETNISPRRWRTFSEVIDFLDVPNWKPKYTIDETPFDGSAWDFRYQFGNQKCNSSGINAFPDNNKGNGEIKVKLLAIALDAALKKKHFIDLF